MLDHNLRDKRDEVGAVHDSVCQSCAGCGRRNVGHAVAAEGCAPQQRFAELRRKAAYMVHSKALARNAALLSSTRATSA